MEMTGAKILMECLLEQGVDLVFGYPGGTILNVYDELYKYRDRITHISCDLSGPPTSRALPTQQTVTPAPPARWACAWPPPAPARPT